MVVKIMYSDRVVSYLECNRVCVAPFKEDPADLRNAEAGKESDYVLIIENWSAGKDVTLDLSNDTRVYLLNDVGQTVDRLM